MKIKKITAKTLKEGKQLVMRELGDEAVILSTRSIKLADDESEIIEIVAAIDDAIISRSKLKQILPERSKVEDSDNHSISQENLFTIVGRLMLEISELKSKIEDLNDLVKYKYAGVLNPKLGNLYKILRKFGISESIALNIVGKISSENISSDSVRILARARELVTSGINIYPTIQKGDKRLIYFFIGSTGAGKSLTLIKLAVITKLLTNSNILIISTDSQKIGAAEQLQTYASIAAIPFKAVYNSTELNELLNKSYEFDFVFIDTIGKSHNDSSHIGELKEYMSAAEVDTVYLVLSGTSSKSNIIDMLKKYSDLRPDALIITKLDELQDYGTLISALYKNDVSVAYLCNGQKIPEDIEPAKKDTLAKFILPDNLTIDE